MDIDYNSRTYSPEEKEYKTSPSHRLATKKCREKTSRNVGITFKKSDYAILEKYCNDNDIKVGFFLRKSAEYCINLNMNFKENSQGEIK